MGEQREVLIVEDDADYARRIIAPHFARVWPIRFEHNVPDALRTIADSDGFAAAIVDLDLPGGAPFDPSHPDAAGFQVLRALRGRFEALPVVIVTAHLTPVLVNTTQQLGAEFLCKDGCYDGLQSFACRQLLAEHPTPARAESHVAALRAAHALSPRQTQIVALALRGLQNDEIADELGISSNTLKRHIAALLAKVGVSSLSAILRDYLRST